MFNSHRSMLRLLVQGYYSSLVDADSALEAMSRYYFSPPSPLPRHDLVLAITSRDLATRRGAAYHTNTAGYAYVGRACVRNSR